ncbi:MAG: 16S rRNA (uracil(1498)-N(3))-methyltransferase [Victivallaceae bacterium]|nr:16S rRNA (uracil(1498)-N(3))-methyltransferase [Victivallaceae bacterium]
MNLILLFKTDFISPDTVSLNGQRFEHLRNVLRVEQGTCVKVGLLDEMPGSGEVIELNGDNIKLRVELTDEAPAALPLTLICALQRPQTMKKVLQAVIAFGVKKIYFIASGKVEKSYWSSPLLEEEALRKHIILGLEQSCDTLMPEIHFRRKFKPFVEDELEDIVGDSIGMTAHPMAAEACPAQVEKPVTLCIGPEGGFTDYEIEMLAQHACPAVHLGTRPLRTEFAICALLGRLF